GGGGRATNKALRGAVLIVKKLASCGALTQSMRLKMREGFSLSGAPGHVCVDFSALNHMGVFYCVF
ncbi:MAG: hypothetical protein FWC01_06730, partial [Treponema sp.]|nr:hypothetical protein [Treponema sp.]MCL2238232.1 hypothetical protein [Treponema sp.]